MDITQEYPMALVQGRVDRLWVRGQSTHHLIIGMSGAGKTGLIVGGILPLCADDRLVFIDVKNDTDPMLTDVGRPIGPRDVRILLGGQGGGPGGTWFRLVVDPVNDHERAQEAVRFALNLGLDIGDMVIATDEVRAITETGQGQLGLGQLYEAVLTRGRSSGVSVISAAAATDNLRPAVRNQWTFAWAGSVNGADVIKSTLGILSLPNTQKVGSVQNPYWPVIRDLAQFEWLYLDRKGAQGNRVCMARVRSWIPDGNLYRIAGMVARGK
jgi:hypothetical protein